MTRETDIAGLRAKATAATPGPWRADFDDAIVGRPTWPCQRNQERGEWTVAVVDDLMGEYQDERAANQAYIAAANPATLLYLLDLLKRAEEERDQLRKALEAIAGYTDIPAAKWAATHPDFAEAMRAVPADAALSVICDFARAALTASPSSSSLDRAEGVKVRAELMRLMREEFDPTPKGWEGRDWNDNAEEVADKMLALSPAPGTGEIAEPVAPLLATRFKLGFDNRGRCTTFRKDQAEKLEGEWVWLIDAANGKNDPLYTAPPSIASRIEVLEVLAAAFDEWEGRNGRLTDPTYPHWSNDAIRLLSLQPKQEG